MTTQIQNENTTVAPVALDGSPSGAKPFHLCSFRWQDRNYVLHQAVECLSFLHDGYWVFECPRYGLSAFASEREEAWTQLGEEFAFLYDGLAQESDEALTGDAMALRSRLLADVSQVEVLACK